MKQIQPLRIWVNGTLKNAVWFLLSVNTDNLHDSATFYYSLKDVDTNTLVEGNIIMDGAAYLAWDTNDYAFTWAANELNIVII